MKKILPSLMMMLLLSVMESANANPVSAEKARLVARNFLDNNGARSTELVDITAESGFSNVYVFTTANSFVIIAADDCESPVLGYSLNGAFDLLDIPENKAAWIQEYGEGIRYAIDHQMRATTDVLRQWNDLAAGQPDAGKAVAVVNPLVQTQWNQGNPYNLLCPSNSVTGCVATAMAQVMKYWNYPEHGIGSHSYVHYNYGELSANFQSTNYDWTNMLNNYSGSSTYAQKQAVATLMYHCGVSVEMDYSPSGSGAVTAHVADALKNYFNYSSQTQHHYRSNYDNATWVAMLKADLDLNRPIQYHGSGSGGGHSFVFDGYNSSNYFHVNWGWGGSCDEYYQISNLNPGPGGIGSGSNGIYNDNQGAIFHAHPSDCVAAPPTNLTYTQNGRTVTFNWNAASGAASYNIYSNTSLVANVTTNTYTHTAPYGSSSYYVRSVDASDEMSLSSNAVTVSVPYPVPVVDDLQANVSANNVGLTWTAPEWCYPATPNATLNYGSGPVYYSWTYTCYGHRYLAANLASYANQTVYKVSTFVQYPGDYTVYVYTNSIGSQPMASSLAATKSIHCTNSNLWLDFDFEEPITITGTTDLWVVMQQQNTGAYFPTPSFNLSSHNTNAFYAGSSPTSLYDASSSDDCAWLINTYLTDGVYTYNIYRNGNSIASGVNGTSYNDSNLASGSYEYYVKTNYYAGESPASNQVTAVIGGDTYYTIVATANPSAGGTITGANSYLEGSTCTLTATANPGYTFANWTENGNAVSSNASYSFTVNANRTLVANFTTIPQTYTISTSANPTNGGNVAGGGSYNQGSSCTVSATANPGYTFANWTENGNVVSNNAIYGFVLTGNRTLTANFMPQTYTISTTANPANGGSVVGGGTYTFGQSCTLTATPATGFDFINWTKDGTVVSDFANHTFTVTESAEYVANFQAQAFTISTSANPANGGSVSGGGSYNQGSSCTVSATTHSGYAFVNWTENGNEVSTNANYTFTVNANRTLVANFTAIPQTYTITVSANPTEGGDVGGGGTYQQGSTCTLTATAAPGYVFINWTKNGTQVSTNATYTFTVTESTNYVAHFQEFACEAPTNVTAEAINYTDIRINWTASPTAQSYKIYRNGTLVTSGYPYAGGYYDTELHFGEYCYTVVAECGYGDSEPSVEACAELTLCDPPGDFTAEYVYEDEDNYGVRLTWKQVACALPEYFHLYKLNEMAEYEPIADIPPAGMTYSYFDDVVSGTYSYMLTAEYRFGPEHCISEPVYASCEVTNLKETNAIVGIYPNPAKGEVTVEGQGLKSVRIVNAYGLTVYNAKQEGDQVHIDLSGMAKGVYVMHVGTANGKVVRQVVVE